MPQPQVKIFAGDTDAIEAEMNAWMAAQPATTLIYQPDITAAHGPIGLIICACVTYEENAYEAVATAPDGT